MVPAHHRELRIGGDYDNKGNGKPKVPGFYQSNYTQLNPKERFSHGANDFKQDPHLTARELAMLGVMNALTDKPNWHEKVMDDEIADKWGQEARAIPLMSEKAWEWCLRELREKVTLYQETGRVYVLDGASRVSKSDTNVSEELNKELRGAFQPLLERPDELKDWHPGSDGQVLDLVHPSLFPLVFGRTRVLIDGGTVPLDAPASRPFEHARVPPQPMPGPLASNKFQWLPCEVGFVEETGTKVKITSYINNLHPSNKPVYAAIEKILSLAIPAWNDTLVHGAAGRTPPRIRTYGAEFAPADLPAWFEELAAADDGRYTHLEVYREARRKVAEYCQFEDRDVEQVNDDDEIDIEDERMSVTGDEIGPDLIEETSLAYTAEQYFECHVRQVVHPDPGVSFTYEQWKAGQTDKGVVPQTRYLRMDGWHGGHSLSDREREPYSLCLEDSFRDSGLQVIIKLASIELTPEKPTYAGGSWHVEGMLNEHIVATALYYYDVENVSEARISFQSETFMDHATIQYDAGYHSPIAEIFGVRSGQLNQEDAIQELGSVTTPQGRLLTFPNTLQHKVEPFELADKTRSGHRRFLAIWLVDPHYRICSTRNVPPQQEDWWKDAVEGGDTAQGIEGLMSLDEAKRLRLELMAQWTRVDQAVQRGVGEYNFCEH